MTERERMEAGLLYLPEDPDLAAEQLQRLDMLFAYNALKPSEQAQKQALLKEMFAEIGENCYIETPFHANFGGKKVHFGNHIYANFNLTLVDDEAIYVGDNVKFGPNVVGSKGVKQTRFLFADLPSNFVKNTRNTTSIPAFFALFENKSAEYKLQST